MILFLTLISAATAADRQVVADGLGPEAQARLQQLRTEAQAQGVPRHLFDRCTRGWSEKQMEQLGNRVVEELRDMIQACAIVRNAEGRLKGARGEFAGRPFKRWLQEKTLELERALRQRHDGLWRADGLNREGRIGVGCRVLLRDDLSHWIEQYNGMSGTIIGANDWPFPNDSWKVYLDDERMICFKSSDFQWASEVPADVRDLDDREQQKLRLGEQLLDEGRAFVDRKIREHEEFNRTVLTMWDNMHLNEPNLVANMETLGRIHDESRLPVDGIREYNELVEYKNLCLLYKTAWDAYLQTREGAGHDGQAWRHYLRLRAETPPANYSSLGTDY